MQKFLATRLGQAILAAAIAASTLFIEELTRQLGVLPPRPTVVSAAAGS